MHLYDEMDMCPTKRYNINSDDHERRGQKLLSQIFLLFHHFIDIIFIIKSVCIYNNTQYLLVIMRKINFY